MNQSSAASHLPGTEWTASNKPTLPFGWIVKQSLSFPDRVYYFNTNTGASTWNVPELVKPYLNLPAEQHSSEHCSFSPTCETETDGSPFSAGGGSDVDYRVSDPVFSQFQKGIYEDMRSHGSTDHQQHDGSVEDVDLRRARTPHFSSSSRSAASATAAKPSTNSSQSNDQLSKFDIDKRKKKKSKLNFVQVHSISNLLSNLRQKPKNSELNQSCKAKENLSKKLSVDSLLQPISKSAGKTKSSYPSKCRRLSVGEPISYEDFCADKMLPTMFSSHEVNPSKKLVNPKSRQGINMKKKVESDSTDLRHSIKHRDLREKLKENRSKADVESSLHQYPLRQRLKESKSKECAHNESSSNDRKPWTKKRKSSELANEFDSKKLKNSPSKLTKHSNDVNSAYKLNKKESRSANDKSDTNKKSELSASKSQNSSNEANKYLSHVNKKKLAKRKNSSDLEWDLLVSLNTNNSGKTSSGNVTKSMKNLTGSDIRKVITDVYSMKKVISVKRKTQKCLSTSHSKCVDKDVSVESWVDSVPDSGTKQQHFTVGSCNINVQTSEADQRIVLPSCTVSPFSVAIPSKSPTPMVSAYRNEDGKDYVCDMEVDEEDNQMIVDLQEVRQELKFHHNEAVGELTQNVVSDSELDTTCKSSRLADKALYIVIDTNVLINDLKFITELRDTKLEGFGLPYFLIPWVVMQELDYIKDGRSKSSRGQRKAQLAVSYLFSCFQSKHPRVQGQSSKKASETLESLQIECNDDRVLQAVHQCMKENEDSCVVLLTEDKNLCNKALVNGIEVFAKKTFYKSIPRLRINCCKKELISLPVNNAGHSSTSTHTSDIITSPVSKQNVSSSSQQRDTEVEFVDEVLCTAKDVIREGFAIVLETEMEQVYENMWLDIVYRKPPWSAYDVLLSIQKHWIAVFGFILNRRLITCVDQIVDKLSPNKGLKLNELRELLRDSLIILKEFKKYSSYKGIVPNSIKQLENLLLLSNEKQKMSKVSFVGDCVQTNSKTQEQTRGLSPSYCERNTCNNASSELNSRRGGMKCSVGMREKKRVSISPIRTVVPKHGVSKMEVGMKDENVRRPPVVLISPRPVPKKQQVVLPTIPQKSVSPLHNVDSRAPEESRKCHDSVAEALTVVQNTFQTIWETINNWCNAIQSAVHMPSNAASKESDMILRKLVPIVTDLRHKYYHCLSFPPLSIRNERIHFDDLCSQLNMFFIKLDMSPQCSTMVTTNDLLIYFGTLDKRPTLQAGLGQLDNMVQGLYESVKQMPD